MTNEELAQTYVALLIIQYADPNNQPNAAATINMLATEAIANQVVDQVLNGFALSTIYGQTPAVGAQLNILGRWVGAQRVLPGYSISNLYFGQQDTTGTFNPDTGGYGSVNSPYPTDYWDSTDQSEGSYTLSDSEMIELIQYLASVNNAYLSVSAIDSILYASFGAYVTLTEGSMELTYNHLAGDPGTLYGIVKYLSVLPHPAGVEVTAS
ncbi:MAG: DUF2612 domain-containing protein [Patescibacteria group bacterium]|nr:DUF2612 domain-containing protein [Patescibacteria group bacterium]